MIIATAGHVDHGKTSLVKALTGVDTDQLEEEKARGLTITPGFAYIKGATADASSRIGFVDVPGHIRFISNMLASVAAVDMALLVIAADDGIMPQTIEHLQILDLLGISKGLVALTKIDRVDEARVAELCRDIAAMLAGTCLAGAEIYPVSVVSKAGAEEDQLAADGKESAQLNQTQLTPNSNSAVSKSVVDEDQAAADGNGIAQLKQALLAAAANHARQALAPAVTPQKASVSAATDTTGMSVGGQMFRLAIDRRFTVKGSGLVVTGSVFSGRASLGDEMLLMPAGIKVRLRGMHVQNQEAVAAQAGDRCALNLAASQLHLEDIHRGNWITNNPAPASNRIDAEIKVTHDKSLRHWTPVHLHAAANHVTGRLAVLKHGDGKPTQINSGETGLVQLVLDEAINVCVGDRIILRDQSALVTLGGGAVLSPKSVGRGRAKPERLQFLACIDTGSASHSLEQLLDYQGLVATQSLAESFNLNEAGLALLTQSINRKIRQLGRLIITEQKLAECQEQLISQLNVWHSKNPGKTGLPRDQVTRQCCPGWPAELADAVLNLLIENGELQQSGNIIGRPGHTERMSDAAKQVIQQVEPLLRENPIKPPVLHDLAKSLKMPPKLLAKMLDEAVKVGELLHPVKNRYFLPEGIDELKSLVMQVSETHGRFTVQQYRDVTGIGRNLSIEILEHFDRTGLTQRQGDGRELRKK